ncbi:fibrinogen-like protein 1 [Asterias rubens]|uniref:fibrinogen-like protein 1 n=1 Tax=Asterias rubens TaxID=7604 RepID=UPI001455CC4F|nr:fibrinogen-like protein 1 [Asterias rubens]
MALFIRSLLVALIVKSQVELQVEASSNHRTVSCELQTSSKIDELRLIVENYLVILDDEVRNTQDLVKELQGAVLTNQERATSEQEETRRMVSELQVAASTNQERATSEQEETRRMVSELQGAVSTNQETTTSELEETRRMVSELQGAVLTNQETTTSELEKTRRIVSELQGAVATNETTSAVQGIRRQLEQLQGSLFPLVRDLHVRFAFKDCSEVLARGVSTSGVYTVQPLCSSEAFRVYCDMETDGGGWTVFQRRQDGSVDFYLDFANYSRGFGNLEGEFWLGNDNLHRLTAQGEYELRVDLTKFDNVTGYAIYDTFRIADVSHNYRLTVGGYSGNTGDSLSAHNNMAFTTKDREYDDSSRNCAVYRKGAWWYRYCTDCNLNGRYFNEATYNIKRIMWNGFSGNLSLKRTEIKIRRKL